MSRSPNTIPGASPARSAFWAGARATFPLIVGATPFGIIFGALAISSGFSALGTSAMSAIVFAGSAQFIAINMVALGASLPIIVATTFVVNLRHSLYSATLAPHLKGLPQRWLFPLAFWLTDESFVVAAKRFKENDGDDNNKWFLLGSELFMYLNWQFVTLIGIRAGQSIPNPASWGLDFAMIATFIGMLVPEIKDRPSLASVVVAGAVAMIGHAWPYQIGLLAAAMAGIASGVYFEMRQRDEEKGDE